MVKKIEEICFQIERLIKNCNDYELHDARNHLRRALSEIKEKQKLKQNKTSKPTNQQKWQFDLNSSSLVYGSLDKKEQKNVLSKIENMIAKEKNKINESIPKDIIID